MAAELENASRIPRIITDEIERQFVLDLGGEPLDGSGFEDQTPETGFEERS